MTGDEQIDGRPRSEWQEDREGHIRAIAESMAQKNLVVAGPGTGKTYTFRRIAQTAPGTKLVLTFIRNLVGDLTAKLGDLADVYTFHGLCAKLVYDLRPKGLTGTATYYPPLPDVVRSDFEWLGNPIDRRDIEDAFHDLDDTNGVITDYIRSGDYYDAVSHSDAVYRVLRHLEADPSLTPAYGRVMVDEYQDFSLLEVAFIEILARKNWILVVGDDDQALYDFKRASPEYIRALAADAEFAQFELPYSTRCTRVLVEAVHRCIQAASERGHLQGRIDKPFISYEPAKRQDSETYPTIIHAHCSVQTSRAPYMARYIEQRVKAIPQVEVNESYDEDFPTALVIGPKQFSDQMAKLLPELGVSVVEKKRPDEKIDLATGYSLLSRSASSRLGWRIVLFVDPLPSLAEILEDALVSGKELVDLLPSEYRSKHLGTAELLSRHRRGEPLTSEELHQLTMLGLVSDETVPEEAPGLGAPSEEPTLTPDALDGDRSPRVVVTTLQGAKGLEAQHVFVVGLNDGHLPRRNSEPTDYEICCLIVALTRARKQCFLLSCRMFGTDWLDESVFLTWLEDLVVREEVKKGYFD
jgi:superfamily I DNA/RNA helicase